MRLFSHARAGWGPVASDIHQAPRQMTSSVRIEIPGLVAHHVSYIPGYLGRELISWQLLLSTEWCDKSQANADDRHGSKLIAT